jgi:licheninase
MPLYWRRVVAVAVAMVATGVSVAGAARVGDFRDDFTSFDTRQWLKSSRPFGYGVVDPANVTVANGLLGVRLPAGKLDGGEMRATNLTRYGSYRVRMKVANAPTALTAFFLYKRPDYAQEVDIEIFNDSSGRIMFSTYANGAQTHTVTTQLPFDATADFHEYDIEYDPGSVRFLVDGVQMQSWSSGITRSSMYLYVNAWFPSWLGGERPSTDRLTYVDWIEHVER